MRTFSEMWSNLAFESFPALFVVLLRSLGGIGDAGLRVFGGTIGLLILGALWLNARWFKLGAPLLSLALVGFNPMIIRYGDSIRAYGLGIFLILLSLGTFWRLLQSFTLRRWLCALLAAVLSVQALYYNAVLLLAISMGACVVALRRRNFGQTAAVAVIGLIAALSLLPYLPIIRRVQTWSFIWQVPFTFAGTWSKLSETLVWPWLWLPVFAVAIIFVLYSLGKKTDERMLFALVTLVVGTIGYAAFLRLLGYLLQPWYFITLLAFVAICLEILLAKLCVARVVATFLIALVATIPAWKSLQARQTNLDLVAQKLEAVAAPGDLILINPFPFGISFQHYYRGPAHIETIPPLSDLRSHRADLLKEKMMSAAPLASVFQEMEETLRNEHTIWLIGGVHFPEGPPISPEPGNFYEAWSEQVGDFLQRHATKFERVRVPVAQPVMHYENVPLSSFHGWQESGSEDGTTRYAGQCHL